MLQELWEAGVASLQGRQLLPRGVGDRYAHGRIEAALDGPDEGEVPSHVRGPETLPAGVAIQDKLGLRYLHVPLGLYVCRSNSDLHTPFRVIKLRLRPSYPGAFEVEKEGVCESDLGI